jgi:hypothetical protein
MPYYPLSQIKPSLYTNGGEYVLTTTQENYIGYYYEISNGKRFTGKTPQDGSNLQIVPFNNTPLNLVEDTGGKMIGPFNIQSPDADNLSLIDPLNTKILNGLSYRFIPSYNPTVPNKQDYTLGVFTRYFCKKTNELRYMEIDQTTYLNLTSKQKTIAWDLYIPGMTQWYVSGDKETVRKANKGLIDHMEKHQKWYGFSQYFKGDFLKYYLAS